MTFTPEQVREFEAFTKRHGYSYLSTVEYRAALSQYFIEDNAESQDEYDERMKRINAVPVNNSLSKIPGYSISRKQAKEHSDYLDSIYSN